jgi:hypothetical protein
MKDIWRGIVRKLKSKDDIRKQPHQTFFCNCRILNKCFCLSTAWGTVKILIYTMYKMVHHHFCYAMVFLF